MRKDKNKQSKRVIIAAIILLLLVAITIGYAGLSTTLNINGSTSISKVEWDIHFENVKVKAGSVTAPTPVISDQNNRPSTLVTYEVELTNPGDYFEFDVDVVNKGTLDAVITDVFKDGLLAQYEPFLNYDVTYKDGSTIKNGDELDAGDKTTYTVRVEFDDSDASNLPEDGVPSLNLTFATIYSQK